MTRRGTTAAFFGAIIIALASLTTVGCGAARERNDSPEEFSAPVTAADLLALTNSCRVVSSHSYKLDNGSSTNICALNGALFWKADMDIDCDGKVTAQCNSSTDCCFQPDT